MSVLVAPKSKIICMASHLTVYPLTKLPIYRKCTIFLLKKKITNSDKELGVKMIII